MPDGSGWSTPLAQVVDMPDARFAPDPVACAALGIATCWRQFYCGWPSVYRCWNADGIYVAEFTPSSNDPPFPCTRAQLAQWLQAETADCAKKVSVDEIPAPARLLVAPGKLGNTVCANASSTRFRIDTPNGSVRITNNTHCPSNKFRALWTVCASPGDAALWRNDLPFVRCLDYATETTWERVFVHSECNGTCIFLEGGTDQEFVWSSALATMAAQFKDCPSRRTVP